MLDNDLCNEICFQITEAPFFFYSVLHTAMVATLASRWTETPPEQLSFAFLLQHNHLSITAMHIQWLRDQSHRSYKALIQFLTVHVKPAVVQPQTIIHGLVHRNHKSIFQIITSGVQMKQVRNRTAPLFLQKTGSSKSWR